MLTPDRVMEHLGCDSSTADTVLSLIRRELNPFTFPAVEAWRQASPHKPDPEHPGTIMCAVNVVIGTSGLEVITGRKHYDNRYWRDCCAVYCNTGDTFAPTILFDTVTQDYRLTTVGDFIETRGQRYGIE